MSFYSGDDYDVTEADEATRGDKARALANVAAQWAEDETQGVRDMYELAALKLGASVGEVMESQARGKAARPE